MAQKELRLKVFQFLRLCKIIESLCSAKLVTISIAYVLPCRSRITRYNKAITDGWQVEMSTAIIWFSFITYHKGENAFWSVSCHSNQRSFSLTPLPEERHMMPNARCALKSQKSTCFGLDNSFLFGRKTHSFVEPLNYQQSYNSCLCCPFLQIIFIEMVSRCVIICCQK